MLRALVEMIVTLVAVYVARQIIAIIAASFKNGGFSKWLFEFRRLRRQRASRKPPAELPSAN